MALDEINMILATCESGEPHPADLSPMDSLVAMGLIELVESDDWIPTYADDIPLDNPF